MYQICIDKIKKKRTFKINDLKSIWLSGILMGLIAFFFFKSDNSFLIAFGVLFTFIFLIVFGIGIFNDIRVINFYDEYFVVKKLFRQDKYYYDEVSSMEIDYLSLKAYDNIKIYIKPYGKEIFLLTYEPLELFFQVKYSYIEHRDKNKISYINVFKNLNTNEQETVKKICSIRRRYKKYLK